MVNADNGFANIMVATDFSAFSNAALSQAVWRRRAVSERDLLHVGSEASPAVCFDGSA
jgi:hypothetical protein